MINVFGIIEYTENIASRWEIEIALETISRVVRCRKFVFYALTMGEEEGG